MTNGAKLSDDGPGKGARVIHPDHPRLRAHAATVVGAGRPRFALLHGFGTDQEVWGAVAAQLVTSGAVLLFDHMGAGRSDTRLHRPERYESLQGYAEDVVEVLDAAQLDDVVLVGHSVSGMISLLAAERTKRVAALVLIAASPRYIDDVGYVGGFSRLEIDELLGQMELDFLGWARALAPAAMGREDRPELGEALTYSFSRADPEMLRQFARATFHLDARDRLSHCRLPTLILQPSADIIVPAEVAAYLARSIPRAQLSTLRARGHYPHISAPDEVAARITEFAASLHIGLP